MLYYIKADDMLKAERNVSGEVPMKIPSRWFFSNCGEDQKSKMKWQAEWEGQRITVAEEK